MDDAALAGKGRHVIRRIVAQPRGRAVGGRGLRARPGLAANTGSRLHPTHKPVGVTARLVEAPPNR